MSDIDIFAILDKILGDDFRTHIQGLEQLGAEYFKCKNIKRNKPAGANDNDIHYMFVTMFVGALMACKCIENPDFTKSKVWDTQTQGKISKLYQAYSSNTPGVSATRLVPSYGLYKAGDPDIKYLAPGTNMFNLFDPNFIPVSIGSDYNLFQQIIMYVYRLVCLLDLTNLTGKKLIVYLIQDTYNFMPLIRKLSTEMTNASVHGDNAIKVPLEVLDKAILNGLIPVVDKIINHIKRIPLNKYVMLHLATVKTILGTITFKLDVATMNTSLFKEITSTAGTLPVQYKNDINSNKTNIRNTITSIRAIANPPATGNVPPIPPGFINKTRTIANIIWNATMVTDTTIDKLYDLKNPPGTEVRSAPKFLYSENPITMPIPEIGKLVYPFTSLNGGLINSLINPSKGPRFIKNIIETMKLLTNDMASIRALLLGLVSYLITEDKRGDGNYSLNDLDIRTHITQFLDNYQIIYNNSREVSQSPNSLKQFMEEVQQDFIGSFTITLGSYSTIDLTTGEFKVGKFTPKKNVIESYASFYENHICKFPDFYDKFFNLIEVDSITHVQKTLIPNLNAVCGKPELYSTHRLNVKTIRNIPAEYPPVSQFGGIGNPFYIITLVPTFGSESIKYFIDTKNSVSMRDITKYTGKLDAQAAWMQILYDISVDPDISTKYDIKLVSGATTTIDIHDILLTISQIGYPMELRLKEMFNEIIRKRLGATRTQTAPMSITQRDLSGMSNWKRQENIYVLTNSKGEVEDWEPVESCALTKLTDTECERFFGSCINNSDEWSPSCISLIDQITDDVHLPIQKLSKYVSKINPGFAASILHKFGFKLIKVETYSHGTPLNLYQVQSVTDWVNEITSNPELQSYFGSELPQIMDMIAGASDPTNIKARNFFNYLNVMVSWVNAHPELSNSELRRERGTAKIYPDPNSSFNSYLNVLSNTVSRLKTCVKDIPLEPQDLSYVPSDLEWHINVAPRMQTQKFQLQSGGGDDDIPYFYLVYKNIYEDLLRQMGDPYGIELSKDSKTEIDSRLEKIKTDLKSLHEKLRAHYQKNRLYVASHGLIDPANIADEDLPALLKKHASLLKDAPDTRDQLSEFYEIIRDSARSRTGLLHFSDVLQTLIRILDEKSKGRVSVKMSIW